MSKKRTAETDLNHDNWDQEEEPDQPGQFKSASEQQMRERKVIKAKRRNVGGSSTSEGLFASFKGFANTPTVQSSPGTFDFLKMLNKPQSDSSTKTNSISSSSTSTVPTPDLTFGKTVNPFANILGKKSQPQNPPSEKLTPPKTEESSISKPKRIKCDEEDDKKKKEVSSPSKANETKTNDSVIDNSEAQKIFEEKVKILNLRFVTFIHDKVKLNPNCILLPPIDDYRKYIEKYVKEKLEAVNTQKLKQEGFNFQMPPRGGTASMSLEDKETGVITTYSIGVTRDDANGASKPNKSPADVGSEITKPSNNFTSGFGKKVTSNANFSFGLSASKESNGPKPTGLSMGSKNESTVKPSFSFSSSDKSETKSSSSMNFSFTSSNKDETKSSEAVKPNTDLSKPNFSFSGGSLNKSDTPAKLPAFSWGSKVSEKNDTGNVTKETPSFFGLKTGTTPSAGFTWGSTKSNDDKSSEKPENTFTNPLTKSFSFSSTTSSTETNSTSTATAAKPFSFGFSNAAPPPPASNKEEEEDEDVLPKEEVKKVVEEDSIFSIKCKIFVMKPDKSYGERGVGNLFVKPVEEKVKAQVIVRTETDTGKIIFNIVVSKNVPIKREKNNLILVTIPHPTTEKSPAPATCLIKVKTAEDAEKLLNCLEQFKN